MISNDLEMIFSKSIGVDWNEMEIGNVFLKVARADKNRPIIR